MRLSDEPDYLFAVPAAAIGDYAGARISLLRLIERARQEPPEDSPLGYLLQVLGSVEACAGNAAGGHALHREAIDLDPASPLPHLLYAKSLLEAFKLPEEARAQLAKAEALFGSTLNRDDPDQPTGWYKEQVHELEARLGSGRRSKA